MFQAYKAVQGKSEDPGKLPERQETMPPVLRIGHTVQCCWAGSHESGHFYFRFAAPSDRLINGQADRIGRHGLNPVNACFIGTKPVIVSQVSEVFRTDRRPFKPLRNVQRQEVSSLHAQTLHHVFLCRPGSAEVKVGQDTRPLSLIVGENREVLHFWPITNSNTPFVNSDKISLGLASQ